MSLEPLFVFSISVVVALLFLLILVIRRKRRYSATKHLASILQPYAREELKDFIIPDGIGGLIEIEHLVKLDQGLLLIETYPISGNLFGAEKIDLWTQIIDGRSYKFSNPLRHIRTSRQAIKALLPNIPIFCRVVFTADSLFPKGKPEEVSVLKTLADDLASVHNAPAIVNRTDIAWERLLRIARIDGQAVQRGEGVDG